VVALVFPAEVVPVGLVPVGLVPVGLVPVGLVPVELVPAEDVPVEVGLVEDVPVEDAELVRSLSSAASWLDRPCWRVSSRDSSFRTTCCPWMHVVGCPPAVVVSETFCMVARLVVKAAGVVAVFPAVGAGAGVRVGLWVVAGVGVGVGVDVGVGVGVDVGVGVGRGLFWLEQSVVAEARSVLVLARRESAWCTAASRSLWAAVIEAVAPLPVWDAPGDLVAVVLAPVVPGLLLVRVLPAVPVVPVVRVPVVPVAAVLGLVLVVPLVLPVVVAAETWPDSAWLRVSSALATCP
jgi:hypothetical protein